MCGPTGDKPDSCASGCCLGAYCAESSGCTARNAVVSIFMLTVILGLVAMCVLGVRAQNAVNAKVLENYKNSLIDNPAATESFTHKE